jgi:SAM-dependent methyltransferase
VTPDRRRAAACPACDSPRVYPLEWWPLRSDTRRALACEECAVVFVHPQPTTAALTAQYAPGGAYRTARADRVPAASKPGAPALLAALDGHFPATRPPAGATILDFGCGTGGWLDAFQDRGWETFGIEPSTDAAFARHRQLDTVPADARFDFVLMHHVLEHLGRPRDTLRDIAASLRPGGHCLVSVPRLDTIDVHRDVEYCLQPRTHIVAFTEACLTSLLARVDLGVVEVLHRLDEALTRGRPTSLRVLARKGAAPVRLENPVAALQRVERLLPTIAGATV